MIMINTGIGTNLGVIYTNQYDPFSGVQSAGTLTFRRAKRSGRNPSTGARTSKTFGLSNIFETGFQPLVQSNNSPIY